MSIVNAKKIKFFIKNIAFTQRYVYNKFKRRVSYGKCNKKIKA
nr:MAG TPA: hypothetical protein [Caudoviricetes sp.]